jgi:tRNA-specific 2-thiouridylase
MMTVDTRVLCGLSGGVDSAVAAALLLEQGLRVEGLFMKNWEDDDAPGYCAAAEDLAMATEVARTLEIPLHKANFSAAYRDRVFHHFLSEYEAGRTPNPDILCNREIKFPALQEQAALRGFTHIATGHYAQVEHRQGESHLLRACDDNKDQTYFLHSLTQDQLRNALFPIGHLTKPQVRVLAQSLGLPNYARKDSTGICFIGERRFRDFLSSYLHAPPGPICSPEGREIGQHVGLPFYTLGQRQGLGIGGVAGAGETPWYVVSKDAEHNRLIVAQGEQNPWLLSDGLRTESASWILAPPENESPIEFRVRHRQPLQRGRIHLRDQQRLEIMFEDPQRAVTPGQSVAIYRGNECLGGAVIAQALGEQMLALSL